MTRRQFFNRALAGSFGAFLLMLGLDALAFWPRLIGGFGSKVDAGPVDDIKAHLVQSGGSVNFFVVSEARAYVVPISPQQVEGSQFNQPRLVAEGLMAMWWRCVHLGCRTPWCAPSAGFECPCHGSKYNPVGRVPGRPRPPQSGPVRRRGDRRRAADYRHRNHRPDSPGAQGRGPLPAGPSLHRHLTEGPARPHRADSRQRSSSAGQVLLDQRFEPSLIQLTHPSGGNDPL